MANATAPELVWMMCGFVSLVWDGAVHTANGCAHDLGAGTAHVALGVAGDPALFTEDELWFDPWGLPSLARPAADVGYGVASYLATGGAMHNLYMWHGGNHYANWSTSDPLPPLARAPGAGGAGGALDGALGAASSAENTVRYANAAPLRSDGTRHEPLFSHLSLIHI